jgi:hypothetical protein
MPRGGVLVRGMGGTTVDETGAYVQTQAETSSSPTMARAARSFVYLTRFLTPGPAAIPRTTFSITISKSSSTAGAIKLLDPKAWSSAKVEGREKVCMYSKIG